MSDGIVSVPMCALDMHAIDQDVVVYRNAATNSIETLVFNQLTLPAFCKAKRVCVTYVRAQDVHQQVSVVVDDEETYRVIGQVEPSGLVYRFFEASLNRTELRLMPRDTNWPRVITVHTFENALVGIDDMPLQGLQPVLVYRNGTSTYAATAENPEFAQALAKASDQQIVIVATNTSNSNTLVVEQVLVPHYDVQTPDSQRHARHQSVPFVQRWPLVRTNDDRLVEWRCWVSESDRPVREAHPPERRFIRIQNESELRRFDWSVCATDVFYRIDDNGGVQVWQWRERMCQTDADSRELMSTLVYAPYHERRVTFTGFRRTYPMLNGASETCTWFYEDLLDRTRQPLYQCVYDAATSAPIGTTSAWATALFAKASLAGKLAPASVVKTVYASAAPMRQQRHKRTGSVAVAPKK